MTDRCPWCGHPARMEFVRGHIVYRPDKPLSCGAHVWIETQAEVKVENDSD